MDDLDLSKELDEILDTDMCAALMIMFNMAQDLVQEKEGKEAQALNILVGSSFALMHAIDNYKEIKKNGKSIKHSSRTSNSENGSRSGGSKSLLS